MTPDEVAVDLYGLPPAEFTAARAARVAEAKRAGDKELAAAIGALRKPTVSAWAVNLLVRAEPGEVDALLRLASALRAAQRELSGERLRELSVQRQQVVNALARRAGALAADAGKRIGETGLREIAATLTAALADPEVAERVRTGTLSAAATYEGFGPAGLSLVPAAAPEAPEPAEPEETGEAARRELDDALGDLEIARAALDSATEAAAEAERRLAEARARITELREELEHAEQQKQFARTGERAAQDQVVSARRQVERAKSRVDRARARAGD
ncbi:hypothetical protein IU433_16410 [Nocardia puris]|uniref:hypothetical protein n=1 Tax=Nocardia puris TaxID=208602 RepID=UPI001894A2D4|nr:hypothetical protein [Nocardia puris]MBF6211737.1 hypothetical protein [Nocardia puris]MBF6365740.1 hypothetical protein [Nocardia puris]MBF6460617.1 hypothetical protein [Nocardia puris]